MVKEDKDIELIDDLTIGVYPRKKRHNFTA